MSVCSHRADLENRQRDPNAETASLHAHRNMATPPHARETTNRKSITPIGTGELRNRAIEVQRAIGAAEGWLALGAPQAAHEELVALEPSCQEQPAVLRQRARVFAALGRLPEAKATIHRLARVAPEQRLALLEDPALDAVWM